MKKDKTLKTIKRTVVIFIVLLILSGITAFPVQTELNFIIETFDVNQHNGLMYNWLLEVNRAINDINLRYPFLSYGTDWLAFAHIVISIFFVGVYQDPIKNVWITKTGIVSCLLIFPVAFIAGYFRGIPLFWQLIDCSFGALGLIPLMLVYKWTKQLENQKNQRLN